MLTKKFGARQSRAGGSASTPNKTASARWLPANSRCARATAARALITVAAAVIERYRAEKDRRGLLDYEDLIDKTLALFQKTSAAWVLYKLDLGIDHVLVDEAQDTSPEQWEIIATLVSEFVQAGARPEKKRTIFAVGDEKQSIFSFQGAQPLNFAEMRDHFRRLFEPSDIPFTTEKLHYSFRSAAEVLDAVDTVFKQPQAFRGLTSEDDLDGASGAARRRARRSGNLGAGRTRREGQGQAGLGRAVRHDERNEPGDQARRPHRAHGEDVDGAGRERRATCSSWCASAGRCSRR